MVSQLENLDQLFQALADGTRRGVVERLCRGPSSVSDLHRDTNMAMPSFLQHLRVLEECGLMTSRKTGRVRTCELVPDKLSVITNWLEQQRKLWEQRLDQLDDYLLKLKKSTIATKDTTA